MKTAFSATASIVLVMALAMLPKTVPGPNARYQLPSLARARFRAAALAVSRAAAPEVMAGSNADSRAMDGKQRWMAWSGASSGA